MGAAYCVRVVVTFAETVAPTELKTLIGGSVYKYSAPLELARLVCSLARAEEQDIPLHRFERAPGMQLSLLRLRIFTVRVNHCTCERLPLN